jgi:hydrogenase/urease accessory protein HupE
MKHAARLGTVLILVTTLLPTIAQAHVGVQTVDLLAGALHPWINLDSALLLIGLSLWLVQPATSTDIKPFVINGLALAAGVASGLFLRIPAPLWLIYCVALAAGLCVSLHVKQRSLPWLIALGWAALLAGYYAGVDAAADVKTPLVFLLGSLAGGFVVPLSIAVILGERRSGAVQIGMRILGSWIAAISLMLLALRLRG